MCSRYDDPYEASRHHVEGDALVVHPVQEVQDADATLDGIRDEIRDAVLEADAQDCSSADCIADAVYEIVRVRLRDAKAVHGDGLDAAVADLFPEAERARWPFTVEQAADALRAALDAYDAKVETL